MKNKIRIYFPAQYPKRVSPAQRYRMEAFEPLLKEENITIDTFPFLGPRYYPILFKPGFFFQKITGILVGFIKRFLQLFTLYKYDIILINREATPLGPPLFEWLYAKVFRKKIIYDFDDAIWLSGSSDVNKVAQSFKALWKVKYLIRWSTVIIAGNDYLFNYAKKENPNVFLIPTVVDTQIRFNKTVQQLVDVPTIGWTGSFSTMPYLEKLIPALDNIAIDMQFKFILISNKPPDFSIPNMEYVEWTEVNEVEKLAECQIGLMPMAKDEWALGKCGFKIIQYMALGIVPIADNWGANSQIIEDELNGFLVEEDKDWELIIRRLLNDSSLRKKIAIAAKLNAQSNYSVHAVFPKLLSVIRGF